MKKNNSRSKRVANKKKAANRQKNEARKNRVIGIDPTRMMMCEYLDQMYIGKTYTVGEVAAFGMGYDETNCPSEARTGSKDMVYIGGGVYASLATAKSRGINIR